MNTYTFLRVPVAYTAGQLDPSPYEQAIHDHAARGWDLVQIFVENPAATVTEHVLIFRRPA